MSISRTTQSSQSSTEPNPHRTCGDESLDQLIADGTIASLSTCCNNDVYGDHNLHITMANGTQIISTAQSIIKSLQINVNDHAYSKAKTDLNSMLTILSIFTRQNLTQPPASFSYKKIPLDQINTADHDSDAFQSNAAEFDSAFNTLPEAVRNVLERRLEPRQMQLGVIDAGDRKIPLISM